MVKILLEEDEKFVLKEDRVLVQIKKKADQQTSSGIILPGSDANERVGTVISIGDDKDIFVKVGDTVVFNEHAGSEMEINYEPFLIMRIMDIYGTVDRINKDK